MHCVNSPGNLTGNFSGTTVLERQTARLKWQQQQHGCSNYSIGNDICGVFGEGSSVNINNIQGGLMGSDLSAMFLANRVIKPDPGFLNGWNEMDKFDSCGYGIGTGVEANFGISRTLSCPPTMAAKPAVAAAAMEGKGKESLVSGKSGSGSQVGKESSKKRKVHQVHNIKDEDNTKDKKMKECPEDVKSKITKQISNKTENKDCNNCTNNKEASATTSKEHSKVTEVQKPDYIHVRARRGQATDSHSLAERVRREKISERMKFLQDLVPGCNKITGKAGMLDEIINYVQSLQRQVEFLSMKLAVVSPRLDFDINSIFGKELIPACTAGFPTFDLSSEITSPSFLQINPMHQVVSCSGVEIGINPDMGIQRTLSAPVSVPETLLDASCFNQQIHPPPTWDADLQNIYDVAFHQARTPFPSHQYTGPESNLKMEL